MKLKKILLIVPISLLFISCSTKQNLPLDTVKYVDIQKYQGKWYEIARFEHFFEKGCKNVTATYEIREKNEIKVINKCTMIDTNKTKEAFGVAYATDNTNSKLKVSFFRPFYGDYWILDLADDYSYVAVGTPSREYLWILSRTKTIDNEVKNKLLTKLQQAHFKTQNFIWTIQE